MQLPHLGIMSVSFAVALMPLSSSVPDGLLRKVVNLEHDRGTCTVLRKGSTASFKAGEIWVNENSPCSICQCVGHNNRYECQQFGCSSMCPGLNLQVSDHLQCCPNCQQTSDETNPGNTTLHCDINSHGGGGELIPLGTVFKLTGDRRTCICAAAGQVLCVPNSGFMASGCYLILGSIMCFGLFMCGISAVFNILCSLKHPGSTIVPSQEFDLPPQYQHCCQHANSSSTPPSSSSSSEHAVWYAESQQDIKKQ